MSSSGPRRTPLSFLVFCFLFLMLPRAVWAEKEPESPDVDSLVERQMKADLYVEFESIRPSAYILKGTLLYLYYPRRSKYLNINSLGFRGAKVGKKTKNAFRIAVLGGSTVFGVKQADFQTIPFFLEELLRQKYPNRKVEVFNLGIEGYTIQRETALITRLFADVQPDLVIYYHGWNDMSMAYQIEYTDLVPFNDSDETLFAKKQKEYTRQKAITSAAGRVWGRIAGHGWWKKERDLDRRRDLFLSGYLKHLDDARKNLQVRSIPVLFVIQPSLGTRKNATFRELAMVDAAEGYQPGAVDFVNRCIAELRNSQPFKDGVLCDLSGAFNSSREEIYVDQAHVNEAGNRIVAASLATLVETSGLLTPMPSGR